MKNARLLARRIAPLVAPLIASVGAIGLGALLAACSGSAPAAADKATPVRVAAATTGPARPPIAASGMIANRDEMRLSFKVGGVIRRIAVQEGASVRKGQLLAEIELAEVDAQVEQSRQLAAKAQRDLERGERLYADQVISLEQLQDLRTQASVAGAGLKSAQFNRGYAAITAPQDGTVLRKLVQERELVPAGQPVLELGSRERGFVVHVALADREVVQLAVGDPAEVRLDAYPDRKLPARVSEIAGGAEPRSGLFPVEVRIESAPVALASGLVAKVSIYPKASRTEQLTYVPIAAVVEGQKDHAHVFVLQGNAVKQRAVHIAFLTGELAALADGVAAGEPVVTDGALYLADGERVEVVQQPGRAVGAITPLLPAQPVG
jgi:RND family efflux transporter MFP subunit